MKRRLRHTDMVKTTVSEARDRYASRRQGPVIAAHILAEAMEDSCRGGDPQFTGNIADALYHIATALQRIAEAMEKRDQE